jgi:hypothetical protein
MANPTTNYGWVLPNSADLVTDLPADFDVALQGVDTSLKALNPATTLGDIQYRSATANTNTRLGIGTNGQILTVASGVPAWSTPAGGATSYALLNSGGTALSGSAAVTISGLSGYNKLFVTIEGASSATGSTDMYMKINAATTNYRDQYNFVAAYTGYDSTNQGASSDTTKIFFGIMATNAASVIRGNLVIVGANSSGVKVYSHWSGATSSTNQYNVVGGGIYTDSNVVSSVTILTGSTNFDAGTIYVYGGN